MNHNDASGTLELAAPGDGGASASAASDGVGDPPRNSVLGVEVSAVTLQETCEIVFQTIADNRKGYVSGTGVHGVIEAQDCEEFRDILNHSLLTPPDGMPLVWACKRSGFAGVERVYGPDLMLAVCRQGVERGVTHYLYGGREGVTQLLASKLQRSIPGLQIVGTYTPPFRPLNQEEQQELEEEVRRLQPDCFWVGLSTPKQERFIAKYIDRLDVKLMFNVGAAFDFHAGLVKQAPRWMQRSGLEWAFRLCMEPRRLWKRYLVNNSRFVYRFCLRQIRREVAAPPSEPV